MASRYEMQSLEQMGRRRVVPLPQPVYVPEEDPYNPAYAQTRYGVPPQTPVTDPRLRPSSAPIVDRAQPMSPPMTDPRRWTGEGGWEGETESTYQPLNEREIDDTPIIPPERPIVPPVPPVPPVVPPVVPPPAAFTVTDRDQLRYGGVGDTSAFNTSDYGGDLKARNSVKNTAGRIFSRYPATPEGLRLAVQDPDFKRFFPNARLVEGGAGDKVDFGGVLSDFESGSPVGVIDVGEQFDPTNNSGKRWQWNDGGGAPTAPTTPYVPPTTPTPPTAPPNSTNPPSPPVVLNPPPNVSGPTSDSPISPEAYRRLSAPLSDLASWRASRVR